MRSGAYHWNRPDPSAPFPDPDWERPQGGETWPAPGLPSRFGPGVVQGAVATEGGRFSQPVLDQPIFNMDSVSPPTTAAGTPVSAGCVQCKSGNMFVPPLPNFGPLLVVGVVAAIGIGLFWWVRRG